MGATAVTIYEFQNQKKEQMAEYLSTEEGYWLKNDQWYVQSESFQKSSIAQSKNQKSGMIADFRDYQCEGMKLEMKYFLLYSMKEKLISATSIFSNYTKSIRFIGIFLGSNRKTASFEEVEVVAAELEFHELKEAEKRCYLWLRKDVITFISDFY